MSENDSQRRVSQAAHLIPVASDEREQRGRLDIWKRDRWIGFGADIVIPDIRETSALFNLLWP
jgi:hypothetical protein